MSELGGQKRKCRCLSITSALPLSADVTTRSRTNFSRELAGREG
jgi:hypothetical protein